MGKKCKIGINRSVPSLIRRNADSICILARSSPSQAKKLILNASPSFLKALSLISYNLLNNAFPMKQSRLSKLTPYADNFRNLSQKNLTAAKRRVEILQGGFLPVLLSFLASAVLPKIIKKIL